MARLPLGSWIQNFLSPPSQADPLIVIRACDHTPGTSQRYVYLDEDWLGINPGKTHQRPICRGAWREMAAIIKGHRR